MKEEKNKKPQPPLFSLQKDGSASTHPKLRKLNKEYLITKISRKLGKEEIFVSRYVSIILEELTQAMKNELPITFRNLFSVRYIHKRGYKFKNKLTKTVKTVPPKTYIRIILSK